MGWETIQADGSKNFPTVSFSAYSPSISEVANTLPPSGELKCMYCSKGHWSSDCKTYPTISSRINKLKERFNSKFCRPCLRDNRAAEACKIRGRFCKICKINDSHHHSLCYQKFGNKRDAMTGTSSHLLTEQTESPGSGSEDSALSNFTIYSVTDRLLPPWKLFSKGRPST